jgi:hypothetical protein
MKKTVIVLSVAVLLEAAVCALLWLRLDTRQRFTHIGTTALTTYIMFDRKTAQACWAGPPGEYPIESQDGKQRQETNGANIPFCKNLK